MTNDFASSRIATQMQPNTAQGASDPAQGCSEVAGDGKKAPSLSQTQAPQTTSNFRDSFAKYGGWAGLAAMFAFPSVGAFGNFVIGGVCGGGGAALGMAVGSFFDALGTKPANSESLPDETGLTTTALILGIIGLVAWLIPVVGLPVTITGYCLGRKAWLSSRRGLALAAIGISLAGLLLSCGNGYLGALMGVRAGMAHR